MLPDRRGIDRIDDDRTINIWLNMRDGTLLFDLRNKDLFLNVR
jgi:hypothetical protein